MSLGVAHLGGATTTQTANVTSDVWTSTPGSDIVVIGFDIDVTGAPANGDVTDAKGNTYSLLSSSYDVAGSGHLGVGIWHSNNSSRGLSHSCTFNPLSGSTEAVNLAVIEFTGQQTASDDYDASTGAGAHDTSSPFAVAAAGAISGSQIAVYGCVTNSLTNNAWTQPSGYSSIINQPDGAGFLQFIASYKLLETGTPSPAASNSGTITDAREVFATFKAAGGAVAASIVYRPRRVSGWQF